MGMDDKEGQQGWETGRGDRNRVTGSNRNEVTGKGDRDGVMGVTQGVSQGVTGPSPSSPGSRLSRAPVPTVPSVPKAP